MSIATILLAIAMWLLLLSPATEVHQADADIAPASATENPLLDLLALVPDMPGFAEAPPGFVDYEALRSVYPDSASFDSWAEWNAAQQADDSDAYRTWMQQMLRLNTGPTGFVRYLNLGDRTRNLIGFEFFDVDRALLTGNPPHTLTIYQGDFQPELISAAYEARDYHASEAGDVMLLSTGEDGMITNVAEREPANPFGGDLGRSEPLALLDGTVIGTPNDALLNTAIETANGEFPSLLEQGPLVAIAEALYTQEATPLQVQYLNVDLAAGMQPQEAAGPLPEYAGAAIADMQLDDVQVAAIVLAYEDEAEAQAAAKELSSRLVTMTIPNDPNRPMLEEVESANVLEAQVVPSESTGLYVAVGMITYTSPTMGNDAQIVDGLIVRWWNQAYLRQEFALLAVTE